MWVIASIDSNVSTNIKILLAKVLADTLNIEKINTRNDGDRLTFSCEVFNLVKETHFHISLQVPSWTDCGNNDSCLAVIFIISGYLSLR